ncbi:hypothetical protein LCGC14_1059050 [marine sediment metagenome]|uniref:histidine kinase n=2 Tax=root TaxID=1 RepID=A0A0F9QSH6_9ZZZZ
MNTHCKSGMSFYWPDAVIKHLRQLTIGQRILVGSSGLVVISLVIIIAYALSLSNVQKQFNDYGAISSSTRNIIDIQLGITELNRRILLFRITDNPQIISDITELLIDIRNQIDTLNKDNISESKAQNELLRSLSDRLIQLEDKVASLNSSRQIQRQYERQLNDLFSEADNTIIGLSDTAKLTAIKTAANYMMPIQNSLSRAETASTRYFSLRANQHKKDINRYLKEGMIVIDEFELRYKSPEMSEFAEQLRLQLTDIKETFYRAVQADRNFIFLINVVVAGETTEIKILADQLKEQSIKEQKALQQNVFIKMTIYQQATLVGSFILLMFAIFISRFVAKSVSIPVKQIADTFSQLTSGHEIEQIPGVDRKDEIGQLARSANVFRENALQTKQLLTESNRLTKSLEAKQAELEMRNTELDNFAYVASHDLKSPLRAIFNLAEWIEEDCYDILPDDSKRHFDTLRSRILRMERLLAELLSYSRVGRVDQDIDIIDVRAVITESIELLDKPASLNMHIQDEFPQILGRETPFKQVFQNIISNAFKYNDKPNCELTISCRKINDSAHEYTIADNGPGIDEDYHNNVFDMFTTLQSRDSIESTGMGLAIVKKVLENEGGSIRIEDNHPGCRFVFCWPDKPLKDS